mmetsp:Transcript_20957/g.45296  ORF Transcript_20957/g.45296 Transcript_20957/m.45296 type:complete len:619 (+) Transcript_20957:446-2302(+)
MRPSDSVDTWQTASWWSFNTKDVHSWAHLVLWFVSSGSSCFPGIHHHSREICHAYYSNRTSVHWPSPFFTPEQCCGGEKLAHEAWSYGGDPNCWTHQFTHRHCCRTAGTGAECWSGEFTKGRCCGTPARLPDLPTDVGGQGPAIGELGTNLTTALERLSWSGQCELQENWRTCATLWHNIIRESTNLQDEMHARIAMVLSAAWIKPNMEAFAQRYPGVAASVALYNALVLIDAYWSMAAPAHIWTQAKDCIATYTRLAPYLPASDFYTLRLSALDAAIRSRIKSHYRLSVTSVFTERTYEQLEDIQVFQIEMANSLFSAFQELSDALTESSFRFVPVQGTLISLLRYGYLPVGGLHDGKVDVVDNDAEVLLMLSPDEDVEQAVRRLSRSVEAKGWPPCFPGGPRKAVCFSMRHRVPSKLEIYFSRYDEDSDTLYLDRECEDGDCTYTRGFPFQRWAGEMPGNIVFPLSTCRLGDAGSVPCPHRPLKFLQGWNSGEYDEGDSLSNPAPGRHWATTTSSSTTTTTTLDQEVNFTDNAGMSCLALPVLTKDRDYGDSRNRRLLHEGLLEQDIELLQSQAELFASLGYASFFHHLTEGPCRDRTARILAGDRFAGLSPMLTS